VSIHETTDASANVVIEVLKNDQTLSQKSFHLSCKEMSAVNHTILIRVTCVAHALHRACEAIRVLYPNVQVSS
jgi:hypothetical protein